MILGATWYNQSLPQKLCYNQQWKYSNENHQSGGWSVNNTVIDFLLLLSEAKRDSCSIPNVWMRSVRCATFCSLLSHPLFVSRKQARSHQAFGIILERPWHCCSPLGIWEWQPFHPNKHSAHTPFWTIRRHILRKKYDKKCWVRSMLTVLDRSLSSTWAGRIAKNQANTKQLPILWQNEQIRRPT